MASRIPPRNGYTKLASLMGPHPEVAIFRRFGSLNAQNLLYMQAELVQLEEKLRRCVSMDYESQHTDRIYYDRDWEKLGGSKDAPDGNAEQLDTILEVRAKLKEYNEALVLQTFIAKQEKPNRDDLAFLQSWMTRPNMGYVYITSIDQDVWEKPDFPDLVVLRGRGSQSLFSRVVGDSALRWYHRCLGRRFRKPDSDAIGVYGNTVHYSLDTLIRLSELIGVTCASVFPVLAIVVLYSVASMATRLALIGVFTAVFSAALGVFTNGRTIEIFSATAAFAAVQVVFVGTTSGGAICT